jgi:hypothetical protein
MDALPRLTTWIVTRIGNNGSVHFDKLDAVKRLIDTRIPESTSLEYKSELHLDSTEDRRELLKDLTGMGNGGGGSIIFGMQEEAGTNVAKELSPLGTSSIVSQIEDIVRSAVHPPLVWSHNAFEMGGGWVVIADIEPSTLGPYMVESYKEQRYYKRTGTSVHPMSEQEVRDAYAIALRARDHRDDTWKRHLLPIRIDPQEPWLVVSALPEEPLSEIFDARQVDFQKFILPPLLANYPDHSSVDFAARSMHHWADGIAGDDGINGEEPRCLIRLHRDGAAGIALHLYPELRMEATARVLNAHLLYLAWFWDEFRLHRPVELEIALTGLTQATMPRNAFGTASTDVVQPAGVNVETVSVIEEVLPWELLRAPVRHGVLRRFCDRLEQAFGRASAKPLFEEGWLYGKSGQNTGLLLGAGLIWEHRGAGPGVRHGSFDVAGQVRGAGDVCAYVVDGVLIDPAGDTLALLEMATGSGCPNDFLLTGATTRECPPGQSIPRGDAPAGIEIPHPTGRWSELLLREVLLTVPTY